VTTESTLVCDCVVASLLRVPFNVGGAPGQTGKAKRDGSGRHCFVDLPNRKRVKSTVTRKVTRRRRTAFLLIRRHTFRGIRERGQVSQGTEVLCKLPQRTRSMARRAPPSPIAASLSLRPEPHRHPISDLGATARPRESFSRSESRRRGVFAECSRSPTPSDPIAIRIPRARSALAAGAPRGRAIADAAEKRSATQKIKDTRTRPWGGRPPHTAPGPAPVIRERTHVYALSLRSPARGGTGRHGPHDTRRAHRYHMHAHATPLARREGEARSKRARHRTASPTCSGAPHLLGVSAGCCCCWRRSGPTRAAVAAASGLAPP
jgi:hypothetical protein